MPSEAKLALLLGKQKEQFKIVHRQLKIIPSSTKLLSFSQYSNLRFKHPTGEIISLYPSLFMMPSEAKLALLLGIQKEQSKIVLI